ncbi:hypothetical protein [Streptococcus caballi]|uniref:hypothetical protein n=1 Tax=Streptococcus caballi TaxID=439220 RepID=UPI00037765DF
MYKILKYDKDSVYLIQDTKIKKLSRELFDFEIELGELVDIYQDGDLTLVLPHQEEVDLVLKDKKSVKSDLLQGILNLFLETLSIHNNDLGNLKKLFSQFLVTLFMAWSLLGVIIIEILLFIESSIVFVWRLLVRGLQALRLLERGKRLWVRKREQAAQNSQEEKQGQKVILIPDEIEKVEKQKPQTETEVKATPAQEAEEEKEKH